MQMNGNNGHDSTFVAFFETNEVSKPITFNFLLPLEKEKGGEYKNMRCSVEFDRFQKYSNRFQVHTVPVTEYTPATATSVLATPVIGFKGVSSGVSSPGHFQLVCSFVYTATFQSAPAAVYASFEEKEGSVSTQAVMRPYNGFVSDYKIYLASKPHDRVSTTFIIRNPHRTPITQAQEIVIFNPLPDEATSGSYMYFQSSSPTISTPCEAYWDDRLRPGSVRSHMATGKSLSMKLVFSSLINSANEIIISCPHVSGTKSSSYLPTIVVTNVPASIYGQNHFTLVSTPEDSSS